MPCLAIPNSHWNCSQPSLSIPRIKVVWPYLACWKLSYTLWFKVVKLIMICSFIKDFKLLPFMFFLLLLFIYIYIKQNKYVHNYVMSTCLFSKATASKLQAIYQVYHHIEVISLRLYNLRTTVIFVFVLLQINYICYLYFFNIMINIS